MTKTPVPRLHLIGPLDGVITVDAYPDIAGCVAGAGKCAIHVRLPGARGGDILNLAREVQAHLEASQHARVLVNDRIDVALVADAAGVHLGEHSIPVSGTRKLVGSEMLIGRSVHDVQGAMRAQADGADYLIAGHVFATASKQGLPGRGLEWLATVAQAVHIPVIAIGGITLERIPEVMVAGVWGVAVGRELLAAPDPAVTASQLMESIEQNRGM